MRVALVHDWLTGMRGGERVLHQLASMFPDADLFTLVHVPGTTSPEIERLPIQASPLSRLPGIARYYRALLPLHPWAMRRFDLSGYDLVISCSHAVARSVTTSPETPHLCYCLTPMRYVWDQTEAYLGSGLRRRLADPLVRRLRDFDQSTSGPDDVTRFVAISSEVQHRIQRAYGRASSRVFPPADTDFFVPTSDPARNTYLLVSPFVPYKRDDVAIEAFRGLDRQLVVVGEGPGRARLQAAAPDNVRFTGRVSDAELRDLQADCRALIQPQDEDFGITAVEVQAAGRPVIALGRGGALDTIRPHGGHGASGGDDLASPPTGVLFETQTPQALRAALDRFEKAESEFDSAAIRAWALGFGVSRFRDEMQREVALTLGEIAPRASRR